MSIALKPGTRLFSAVCTTEMITVKAPAGEIDLTIGGAAPVANAAERDGSGGVVDGHGEEERAARRGRGLDPDPSAECHDDAAHDV